MKGYRFLHRWHKRLGVFSAIVLIILLITGLLLNHTESFRLDSRFVSNTLLMNWYGVEPNQDPISFQAGDYIVSQIDDQLFLDQQYLPYSLDTLLGAVYFQDQIILAGSSSLILLDTNGELIEQLSNLDGVPAGLQKISRTNDQIRLQAAHGIYLADLENVQWEHDYDTQADQLTWSAPVTLEGDQQAALLEVFRGRGLSLERVMLDLHSGRLFGTLGVIIVDLAALFLGFLALSGFWMWYKLRKH